MIDRYRGLIRPGTGWRWVVVVALAVVVSGLEAIGAVLIYALMGLATDANAPIDLPYVGSLRDLIPAASTEELIATVAIAVAAFLAVRGVAIIVQAYAQSRVATAASTALSVALLDRYLRLPYSYHLRRNSSELIRNANESVLAILGHVLMPSVRILAQGSIVVGLGVVLLITAPMATILAAAVLAPTTQLVMRTVRPRIVALGATSQRERGRSLQLLQQSLHGFRDITVLGRQDHFVAAFRRSRHVIARTRYLRAVLGNLPRLVIEAVTVGMVAVFIVTATLAGEGAGSLAVVGLFAYAALRLMPALNSITVDLNELRYGRAAIDAVRADLNEPLPPTLPSVEPLTFRDRLVAEELSFTYPDAPGPTLRGINLTLKQGSSLGIVGPTGAGKSTLVDLLVGLSTPTTGRITVDGVDMLGNEAAWHRNLGMVSQEVFLLDDTLRGNIALGVPGEEIDEEALHEAVELAQLTDFLTTLPDRLDTWVGERGTRVSGGQRQRIAIARALYPRPSVLVFDEGTSALDNVTEAALTDAIKRLRGDHTIITIAHRLSTVRDHQLILFLDGGRVAAQGSFEQLLEHSDAFRRMARSLTAN